MALIKCIDCGKEISDTAECCPNCGLVLNAENKFEGYKLIKKDQKKINIGLYSVIFGIIFPIAGLILGIIGLAKGEKYSLYGLLISILMPILYFFLLMHNISGILF